ncbi:MAG: PadR family transcriptional regulator [Myxococcota bacterium]
MSKRWLSQVRKGLVEYCVLELLYQHHESYGYAIMKSLEDVEALRFNESTIYLALGRLTRGGVLASRHVTAESGRKRRYFRLTAKGREILMEMRLEWNTLSQAIDGLQRGAP